MPTYTAPRKRGAYENRLRAVSSLPATRRANHLESRDRAGALRPTGPAKDNYAAAFVTTYAPVAPRVESQPAITTSFAAPQAKGDHHILKNIGKGFLIGAGIAGLAVLNVERCQIEASNYPLFLRRAAYRACSGY